MSAVLAKSFFVEIASDLTAALDLLSNREYDVIVLDMDLPGSTGLDSLGAIKVAAASAPIVALTAERSDELASQVLQRGAQDYVEKRELVSNTLERAIRHAIDRKCLEDQLLQSQKLEAVGELAAGIAHEFNNLLQTIRGYTEFAIGDSEPESQVYKDLCCALRATDDAARLTKQLLCFGRRNALQRRTVKLNPLIEQQLEMLRPLIGETIELRIELGPDAPKIHVDSTELQQVVMNLCINARDAMPNGGQVTIRTESQHLTDEAAPLELDPGDYVLVTVEDSGMGMPAEVQQRIFEPFFTTKEVGKGTGMGMAMVYGAMQQHRGAIRVDSKVGVGTKMSLFFPVAADGCNGEKQEELPAAQGGVETILIAEDNVMVRDLAVRILERAGYQTRTAANGAEAISVFEEYGDEINLALLDVVMPKMTGREVYEVVSAKRPELPFVFCTGYDPDHEATEFVNNIQLPLVRKPFTPDALLHTVRETLDEARAGVSLVG